MNRSLALNRLLLTPLTVRAFSLQSHCALALFNLQPSTIPRQYATQSITQASFWRSLIPKPLRKSSSPSMNATKKPSSKEWNPATFFIFIFLLIGSMSIQMIALRNDFTAFSRRADAKIGLLREIIERVQKGEEVDVEGLLGTGDKEREKEWEEVLKEIEREDEAWELSRRKKPKHGKNLEPWKYEKAETTDKTKHTDEAIASTNSNAPTGFY